MLDKAVIGFLAFACICMLISCGAAGKRSVRYGVITQLQWQSADANTGSNPENSDGGNIERSGPIPSIRELDQLIANPLAASIELNIISPGIDAYTNGLTGTNCDSIYSVEPTGATLVLRAFAKGEYSYAVYAQTIELPLKPKLTRITALPTTYGGSGAESTEPIPLCYYAGFADYTVGTWRWFGPFSSVDTEVEVNTGVLQSRFVSPTNRYYICVLASNGSKAASALPADGLPADFPIPMDERAATQAGEDPGGLAIIELTTWLAKGIPTLPAKVTGLRSTYTSDNYSLLYWNDDPDPDVDFYEVFRDDLDDDIPRELLAEVAAPKSIHADKECVHAKYYRYWVRAHNAIGYGGESRLDAAGRLVAPVPSASCDNSELIHLSWTPEPGGLKYFLYRSDTSDGEFGLLGEFSPDELTYDDLDTPLNEWRYYRMEVQGEDFDSGPGGIRRGMRTHNPLVWEHTWEAGEYGTATGTGVDGNGCATVAGYSRLPALKQYEAVTLKYGTEGELLWERTWGGSYGDFAESVAVDDSGNAFVAGRTSSFGAGANDCFLLKYDSNGELLWQRTWGESQIDSAYGIALSDADELFVVGSTSSFGAGKSDVLILKYDLDGNVLWQKAWGTADSDAANGVAARDGRVIVTGRTYHSEASEGDILVMELNSEGELQWARVWGTESDENSKGVALDDSGNAYVVGTDFFYSILLLKYALNGSLLHQSAWSAGGIHEGNGIAVDESGADANVFVTGLGGGGSYSVCLLRYSEDCRLLTQKAWSAGIYPYVNTGRALVSTRDGVTYLCGVGNPGIGTFTYNGGSVTIGTVPDAEAEGTLTDCAGLAGVPAGSNDIPTGIYDDGGLFLMRLDSGKI